jgi:hypothetical protein
MKNFTLFALLVLSIGFGSCRKSGFEPSKPKLQDTLSDSALFKVQLVNVNDSLPVTSFAGRNETLIIFNHAYRLSFHNTEDSSPPGYSPYLTVMAITSDGIPVLTDGIPYKAGVSVPLLVAVASGQYVLRAYYLRWFPQDIHIWCKDNFLKDSVDLRKGNYQFTVDQSDPNQWGMKRFVISIGPK